MARTAGSRDYRDLTQPGGKKAVRPEQGGNRDGLNHRWWLMRGDDAAESIADNVAFLQKSQSARLRQQVINARLYGNLATSGVNGPAYTRLMQSQTTSRDRVTSNETQSIIDTLTSRIGETKPRPYYLTSGGNYKEQRRAKKLNQYIEGVFYETRAYELGIEAFRSGLIQGDGFVHAFNRNGRTHHEVVAGHELWVDEVEAQYGYPRNMVRLKLVDREELAAWLPEKRKIIMDAVPATDAQSYLGPNIADMVTVAEAWHLGNEDENGDVKGGKHAIVLATGGKMLLEPEEWPFDFFPFARFSWCKRPIGHGYWSQGVCEQLQGEQVELNKELWLIQRSMHLAGSLKVMVKTGSKIVKEQINNEIGTIINYVGEPPTYYCPEPINAVYFQNVDRIRERMRSKIGVSEMSSAARKPAGLNSGAALREFEDIESDRHRATQRANDAFYLELAAIDIALAGELPAGSKVRVPNKVGFNTVDFKRDIGNIKRSEFVMQCFPVSRLPRDPSGRLQTIQEYIQAGFITQRQGRRALDFADIDSIESLANAQEDMLTKVLDAIVDDGEYQPPEPTDDLQLASEMVVEYIQRFRALDLESEKLELLRTFNSQVQSLMDRAAAASMPPLGAMSPAPSNAPQAAPMPPPQSDLIPNAPGARAA